MIASAHAKVILFGEHAVVYGQPALAAALASGVVVTEARVAERFSWQSAGWPPAIYGGDSRQDRGLTALIDELRTYFDDLIPHHLDVRFDVPVGAGLGSSASLAVTLARAYLAVADLPAADEVVLACAGASEGVFHGNPSGVDHTTAALGGMIRFARHETPPMQRLDHQIPLVVAQMEPGADTSMMVAGVAARHDRHPEVVGPALQALGQATEKAISALAADDWVAVGELMNIVDGVLAGLGVSTPALTRGCQVAREAGALGAKLTGAGGGGCLIALPADHGSARTICAALEEAQAHHVFVTTAGG